MCATIRAAYTLNADDAAAVLLGVPFVTVGFRTFEGRLATIQTFRTLDIPKLCVL